MHSSETIKLKYTMTGGNFVDKLSGTKKTKASRNRQRNEQYIKNEAVCGSLRTSSYSRNSWNNVNPGYSKKCVPAPLLVIITENNQVHRFGMPVSAG